MDTEAGRIETDRKQCGLFDLIDICLMLFSDLVFFVWQFVILWWS